MRGITRASEKDLLWPIGEWDQISRRCHCDHYCWSGSGRRVAQDKTLFHARCCRFVSSRQRIDMTGCGCGCGGGTPWGSERPATGCHVHDVPVHPLTAPCAQRHIPECSTVNERVEFWCSPVFGDRGPKAVWGLTGLLIATACPIGGMATSKPPASPAASSAADHFEKTVRGALSEPFVGGTLRPAAALRQGEARVAGRSAPRLGIPGALPPCWGAQQVPRTCGSPRSPLR